MRKSIRDAILTEVKAARAIAEAAEKDARELSTDEQGKIEEHLKKAADIQANAEKEGALRKQMTDITAGLGLIDNEDGTERDLGIHKPSSGAAARKSLGERFTGSAEFKNLLASVPGGRFGEKARVQSAPFGVKELFTGANHDTDAGALVRPDYRGLLDPFFERPLTVRDLFTAGNTTSDTIEYVRMVNTVNRAAPVAEAVTHAAIGSGNPAVTSVQAGVKPESGFEFEKDSTTVKTIAHWIPATKRALSDAAQIRTMIDNFLRYGLEEELEDQLMSGNGVGENLLGLTNTSGVQVQPAPGAGEDVFDVTRRARRRVRIGGRANPSAYVMNPIDWEEVELRRDTTGNFYAGGPFNMATPRLWGLPVIESEAVPVGTAWCADWRMGVVYDREQASIQVTDSHADFFIRNLVAILAEFRAAFAILRPAAFVRIDLGL